LMTLSSGVLLFQNAALSAFSQEVVNSRPIIGILAQEHYDEEVSNTTSYLAAGYVKSVEAAGARVVPVLIDQPADYYENLGNSLNGFLFPGGGALLHDNSGYARSARFIYDIVMRYNKMGVTMPLWGTCLGFEMLNILGSPKGDPRVLCNSYDQALPLEPFLDTSLWNNETRIFEGLGQEFIDNVLTKEQLAVNFHHWCTTPENFTAYGLVDDFKLISTNHDIDGLEFVSTMEHKQYPIFGTQWHPEKNTFAWTTYFHIPHSEEAIQIEQFLMNRFVHYARMNPNQFSTEEEEQDQLIYNYTPIFVEKVFHDNHFDQAYLFKKNTTYSRRRS